MPTHLVEQLELLLGHRGLLVLRRLDREDLLRVRVRARGRVGVRVGARVRALARVRVGVRVGVGVGVSFCLQPPRHLALARAHRAGQAAVLGDELARLGEDNQVTCG